MAQAMTEVSYDAPRGLPDAALLLQAAQRLIAIPEASERQDAIATLFKLVDGILAAPEEPKKRRVKKANETFNRKVGRFVAGIDFLLATGFLEGDDPDAPDESGKDGLLFMPVAHLMRLTDAHHTLTRAAQEAGIEAPPLPSSGFNPFSSTVQAADTTTTAKAPQSWKGETERVRDEVKKRQRELKEKVDSAPPVDLQPTAFWLSGGRRLEEVIRETAEADTADRATDNALLQAQVASAKNAINSTNTKFESADKKLLSDLSRKKVHEFCILRIVCPDKSVLQVHFRACERGEQVLGLIAPLFAPHVREAGWYIYQSPPLKRLSPKETMRQAGFTPGANLYLGFEGGARPEPPYLMPSLASQLGPSPAASEGVNAPASFSGEAMGWGVGQKVGGSTAAAAPAAASAAAGPAVAGTAVGSASDPVPMEP